MGGSDASTRKSTTAAASSSTSAARMLASRRESADVEAKRGKASLGFFNAETPALKRKSTIDGGEAKGESEARARKSLKVAENSNPGGSSAVDVQQPLKKGKEKVADVQIPPVVSPAAQEPVALEPAQPTEDEAAEETTEEFKRAAAQHAEFTKLTGLVQRLTKTDRTMTSSIMDHTKMDHTKRNYSTMFNLSELSKDDDDASDSGSGSDPAEGEVEDLRLEDMRATVNARAVSADVDEMDDEHDAEGDVAMILAQPNEPTEVHSTTPPHSPPPAVLAGISHAPSVPGPKSPNSFSAATASGSSISSSKASVQGNTSAYSIFSAPKSTAPSSAASSLFNVPISEPTPAPLRREPSVSTVFSKPKPAIAPPKSSTTPVAKEQVIESRPPQTGSSIFSSIASIFSSAKTVVPPPIVSQPKPAAPASSYNPFSRPAKSEPSDANKVESQVPDKEAPTHNPFSRPAKPEFFKENFPANRSKGIPETRTQLDLQPDSHNPFSRPFTRDVAVDAESQSQTQTETESQATQTTTMSSLASGASWFNPSQQSKNAMDEEDGYDTDITGSEGGGSQGAVVELVKAKATTVTTVKAKAVVGKASAPPREESEEAAEDSGASGSDFAIIEDEQEEAVSCRSSLEPISRTDFLMVFLRSLAQRIISARLRLYPPPLDRLPSRWLVSLDLWAKCHPRHQNSSAVASPVR